VRLYSSVTLGVLALLLSALVWFELTQGGSTPAPIEPVSSSLTEMDTALASPVLEAFAPPDLGALTETVDRPLFAASRRPAAPAPVVAAPREPELVEPLRPPELTLTAVVIAGDDAVAVVRSREGNQVERLRQGDEYQGWEVERVAPEALHLLRDGTRHEIALRKFEAAPRPAAPVPRGPAARAARPAPAAARPRRPQQGPRQRSMQQPRDR
jgi:hypothetical protein